VSGELLRREVKHKSGSQM